jgi:hypothetical protein
MRGIAVVRVFLVAKNEKCHTEGRGTARRYSILFRLSVIFIAIISTAIIATDIHVKKIKYFFIYHCSSPFKRFVRLVYESVLFFALIVDFLQSPSKPLFRLLYLR